MRVDFREAIRPATAGDAPAIQAIYARYVTDTPISFETEAPDVSEILRRMRAVTAETPWLVCEEDGAVVGYAYGSKHRERAAYRWSADVSVYLAATYQRRGLGRLLYARLLNELIELGYYNAFAGITLPNAASVGLHEAMGFAPVGVYRAVGCKQGQWYDVGWWQKTLRPPSNHPEEPRRPPTGC